MMSTITFLLNVMFVSTVAATVARIKRGACVNDDQYASVLDEAISIWVSAMMATVVIAVVWFAMVGVMASL